MAKPIVIHLIRRVATGSIQSGKPVVTNDERQQEGLIVASGIMVLEDIEDFYMIEQVCKPEATRLPEYATDDCRVATCPDCQSSAVFLEILKKQSPPRPQPVRLSQADLQRMLSQK